MPKKIPMKDIQIKNESKAVRCEICHQTDLFNSLTDKCLRCKDVIVTKLIKEKGNREALPKKPDWHNIIFCLVNIALMPFIAIFSLYFIHSSLSLITKFLIFIAFVFLYSLVISLIEIILVFIRTRKSIKKSNQRSCVYFVDVV